MRIGCVYRIRTTLVNPPKEKIVLYVGNDFFLWFNTEPRKRPGQLAVAANSCPGIVQDCHLDCGRVTIFPEHELAKATECGEGPIEFIAAVVEEVELRAPVLVGAHRTIISEQLRRIHPTIPFFEN